MRLLAEMMAWPEFFTSDPDLDTRILPISICAGGAGAWDRNVCVSHVIFSTRRIACFDFGIVFPAREFYKYGHRAHRAYECMLKFLLERTNGVCLADIQDMITLGRAMRISISTSLTPTVP